MLKGKFIAVALALSLFACSCGPHKPKDKETVYSPDVGKKYSTVNQMEPAMAVTVDAGYLSTFPEMPITDLSLCVGFRDQAVFIKAPIVEVNNVVTIAQARQRFNQPSNYQIHFHMITVVRQLHINPGLRGC